MQQRHRELINKKTQEQKICSEKNDKLFLQTLESELLPDMLKSFNEILNDGSNILNFQETTLFTIWKKYALKDRHLVTVKPNTGIEDEAKDDDNDEGILIIDCDMNSEVSNEATSHLTTNNQMEQSRTETHSSEGLLLHLQDMDQPSMDSLLTVSRQSLKSNTPDLPSVKTSIDVIETPSKVWKNHLHWPNIGQSIATKGKKKNPICRNFKKVAKI